MSKKAEKLSQGSIVLLKVRARVVGIGAEKNEAREVTREIASLQLVDTPHTGHIEAEVKDLELA